MDLKVSYRSKIKATFPELKFRTSELITDGADNDVLILDNKYVFRFPKNEYSKKSLVNEILMINSIELSSNIVVPRYIFVSPDLSFAGYKYISIPELDKKQFNNLDLASKKQLSILIAEFLSSVAKSKSKTPRGEFNHDGMIRYFKIVQSEARRCKLSLEILDLYERKLNDLVLFNIPNLCNVHSDLRLNHIYFDKNEKILGVIDFSEGKSADPAYDFRFLYSLGIDFVKDVYHYYNGPKDRLFLLRAEIYYYLSCVDAICDLKNSKSYSKANALIRTLNDYIISR